MSATLPGIDMPPAAPVLTSGERRALAAVDAYIAAEGYAPSVRELAVALGCWPSLAGRYLDALAAKGAIRRAAGRARGLVVLV